MRKYFGTDGVRGLANRKLTPELVFRLGMAYGHSLHGKNGEKPIVLIAQDPRRSSDMLSFALLAGLTTMGCVVKHAEIFPTPGVSHSIRRGNFHGGAMISASHNPYYDNGVKFFDHQGFKLSDEAEKEIERLMDTVDLIERPVGAEVGYMIKPVGLQEEYMEANLQVLGGKSLEKLSIGLDCANGATCFIAPEIFKRTGAALKLIHHEPTGLNINEKAGSTDPTSLQALVVEHSLDIGFAFDGDGDRLMVVDEKGNIVDGDEILSIIAVWMKSKGILARNTLVTTVMSNSAMDEMSVKEGIQLEHTKVGDRYVLEKMRREGYNLGGEPSGHIIMSDYSSTGDGIIAALVLARILAESGEKLSTLNKFLEKRPQVLINVAVNGEKMKDFDQGSKYTKMIKKAESKLKDTGRVLVRASGTEPKIRVLVEGKNELLIREIADELAAFIQETFA